MSSITKGVVSIGVVGNSGDVEQLYITEEWRSIGNKKNSTNTWKYDQAHSPWPVDSDSVRSW